MTTKLLPVTWALALFVLLGCGREVEGPALSVENAWARPMMMEMGEEGPLPGTTSAVYLEILNRSPGPDRLLGGETDAADRVEIHESILAGDVVRMRRVEGVDLPQGVRVALAPGSLHLMLLDLRRSLVAGDTVSLTLVFQTAPPIAVRVPVRGAGEG